MEHFARKCTLGVVLFVPRVLSEDSSPPDKVDDLEAVAFGECGLRPFGARHDLAIVLDGDAVALESELGDEAIQT